MPCLGWCTDALIMSACRTGCAESCVVLTSALCNVQLSKDASVHQRSIMAMATSVSGNLWLLTVHRHHAWLSCSGGIHARGSIDL